MSELMRFLLARIADDEGLADGAAPSMPAGHDWPGTGWWSPARVMAECEMKRRILLLAENPMGSPAAGTSVDEAIVAVLRCLTLPYRHHPEYRAEWHP